FRCESPRLLDIACAPAEVYPHVAAVGPTQLLQALCERGDAGERLSVVRRKIHQRANAAHALLRVRDPKRRDSGRAGEERDELATSHRASQGSDLKPTT